MKIFPAGAPENRDLLGRQATGELRGNTGTHTMERRLSIHNLYLTRPRTSNYKTSFAYSAAKSYNNLANEMKQATQFFM